MKFVDLGTQFKLFEPQIRSAIDDVLAHGQFIMGPEVALFEKELADYVGVDHVISCASGTDALLMSLMAYDVGPGDAIFTSPFTFFATAEVIGLLRATPVFVDVDEDTFNIDPNKLTEAVQKVKKEGKLRPRGIIPVDLFGLPADYDAINQIAAENELFVLEDAAQSLGAQYKGRYAGALAPIAATSFFPAKTLGAYGDGGAIFTSDDQTADTLKSIRFHGMGKTQYDNIRIGVTGRLDTIQAAILRCKLTALPDEIASRQHFALQYQQKLGDAVVCQKSPPESVSSCGYFSVLHERRDEIRESLSKASIPTAIYYATALHLQPVFAMLGYQVGDFPNAEKLSKHIFSLPMHPYLEEQQVDKIIDAVKSAVHSC